MKNPNPSAERAADDLTNSAIYDNGLAGSLGRQGRARGAVADPPKPDTASGPVQMPALVQAPASAVAEAPPVSRSSVTPLQRQNATAEEGQLQPGAERFLQRATSRRQSPTPTGGPRLTEVRFDMRCSEALDESVDELATLFAKVWRIKKIKKVDVIRACLMVMQGAGDQIAHQVQQYMSEQGDLAQRVTNADHEAINEVNRHMAVVLSRAIREAAVMRPPTK